MRLDPASFLIGLGAALVVPMFTRVFRPLVVEAAAAGMVMWDQTRRMVAEQTEALEDLAAEARARREALLAEGNGHLAETAAPAAGRKRAARRRSEARHSESTESPSS